MNQPNYPIFEENNLAAIGMNRARDLWHEVKLISKYKHGRHGETWETYSVAEQAEFQFSLSSAWGGLGLQSQDRVAIMSKNRPEWVFTINSLLMTNLATVPIYPTVTAEEAAFILRDSGARFVVVDSLAQAERIDAVRGSAPALEGIIIMDALEKAPSAPMHSMESILQLGREALDLEALYRSVRETTPEHLAAIIYTSGTTGVPKGVMLTHGNFLSQRPLQTSFNLGPDDVFLNHLPFCHVFGLTADLFGSTALQATLVIADGIEPEKIRHALHTIRPTVLMSVPRLFEKVYLQVQQVVEQRPPAVRKLFHGSLAVGKEVFDRETEGKSIPLSLAIRHRFARRIAKRVLSQAGLDRVRLAYAGGAPTSKELCHFFQGLGINLYQGYGLTETSPVATVNLPGKNKLGTVGPPIEGVEVKIAEDGEILIRGANIMKGYFNNPAATAEAINPEGWFHSGDIGEIDADGYLIIRDRKKELIVTSGGKNIAPLPIESAFNTDVYIERVVVIGDQRNYLTALVCPEFGNLRAWAATQGLALESDQEIAAHPEVRKLLEGQIAAVNSKLPRFQQIKKFAILDHAFSTATGEITPTEKLKRRVIVEKYADLIEGMYADVETGPGN